LLAAEAAARQWRVFFLGAAPGVAERAAAILKAQYPNLIVAGTWAGSPDPKEDDVAIARIQESEPHLVLVAYGAPAQDKWIARNRDRLNGAVWMGVGGAFDFITSEAVRAPKWIQRLGLEWLHRLVQQPWRWRRMLALPRFVWAILFSDNATRSSG
jgi:N-acetylglucosaminyldiphosphoundecaprenol N-acetyl-beta-D-mannosaminyltransferase